MLTRFRPSRFLILCAIAFAISALSARASISFHQIEMTDGAKSYTFDYAVGLPENFDPAARYGLLILLPSGEQSVDEVRQIVEKFAEEAARRHWIILSPACWNGVPLHQGTHALVPPLVDHVRERLPLDGAPVFLAGGGAGGQSALEIAAAYPDLADGVVVFPGIPFHSRSLMKISNASHMSFDFFAGGRDSAWLSQIELLDEKMQETDVPRSIRVFPDADRDLSNISTAIVMEKLDFRRGAFPQPPEDALRASRVLTMLHEAAASADEGRYFSLYAPEAIFMGTDATERWTLDEFRDFAAPHFRGDSAWTYTTLKRSVTLAPSGDAAWFDETLTNERLGLCRGTGALRKIDGAWRITQYNLTIPVPNDLADEVVDKIREAKSLPMLPQ